MTQNRTISFRGKSGTSYVFAIYSSDSKFDSKSAVYVFGKYIVGPPMDRVHPLYIGETENLAERIP